MFLSFEYKKDLHINQLFLKLVSFGDLITFLREEKVFI